MGRRSGSTIDRPLTLGDLDTLALRESPGSAGSRIMAETLERFADATGTDGEVSRAELLAAAAEQWQLAGEDDRAIAVFGEAARDGSVTRVDPRAQIATVLHECGRDDEARSVLRDVPLRGRHGAHCLFYVGALYAALGELDEAHRWLTKGVLLAQKHPDRLGLTFLLVARHDVRRELGLPHDDFDEVVDAVEDQPEQLQRELVHELTATTQDDELTVIDLFSA